MDRLAQLREGLWARWRQQGERLPSVLREPVQGATVLYSRKKVFDLKNYEPREFAAGGRTSPHPFPGLDNHVYHVDDLRRPVRCDFRHSYNKLDWRGVYTYRAEGAEYSEWCLQTGVCSQHDRVVLEGDQHSTFERLTVNTAGSAPTWKGFSQRVMNAISSNPNNYSVWIEAYTHREGRIVSGVKYTEGMGSPPRRATLNYVYDGSRLDRILHRWETGEEETIYAAPRTASLRQLSADLSQRMADRIIELVRDARLAAPLELLELSYLSLESLVPILIPCLEGDRISSLLLVTELDAGRWIQMREEEFAPEITDFRQRISSAERSNAASRMLRQAARQVTERGPAHFQATRHFVAYAIDWEAEGDDLEAILRQCGASTLSLKAFKARGWL